MLNTDLFGSRIRRRNRKEKAEGLKLKKSSKRSEIYCPTAGYQAPPKSK